MGLREFFSLRGIRYSLIIVLTLVIGILLGRFITNYETRYLLNREFCGSYRGMDIYKCGDINDENTIGYLKMLEMAPDIITEPCTAMYFTGDSLSLPIIGSDNGSALGLTQDTVVFIATQSFNVDVVYHELFHVYDNSQDKLSQSYEFRTIADSERDGVVVELVNEDAYYAEFFASAGAAYLLEPHNLAVSAPLTYDYLNQLLGEYE